MSRILKELDKLSVKEQGSYSKSIQESQLLLEAPKESLQILRTINLDHQIRKSQKEVELIQKVAHFKQSLNLESYTGKQLEELCIKYDLKVLPAMHYKGKLDSELPSKLSALVNDKGARESTYNYFILAPRETFKGSETDDLVMFFYRESEDRHSSDRERVDKKDVLSLVHSWGKDYKSSRKRNWLWFDSNTEDASSCTITIFSIMLWIMSLVCYSYMILTIIISVVSAMFFYFNSVSTKNKDLRWNQEQK